MRKKKEFVEGIDYVITIRKRKKFIKNPKKNICPICENCNHKNLCLNRRNKETIYRPNELSILELAEEIEENKYNVSNTRGSGYNRNMQTNKACSAYNFMLKPIQNVTRNEIERFLQAERHKANSTISKEYSIVTKAFELAYKKNLINAETAMNFNLDPIEKPKSYKEDKDVVAFTMKEEYILVQYMNSHYSQYNNMILLALYTGMRIGEVLALTTDDINFDQDYGAIRVTKIRHIVVSYKIYKACKNRLEYLKNIHEVRYKLYFIPEMKEDLETCSFEIERCGTALLNSCKYFISNNLLIKKHTQKVKEILNQTERLMTTVH